MIHIRHRRMSRTIAVAALAGAGMTLLFASGCNDQSGGSAAPAATTTDPAPTSAPAPAPAPLDIGAAAPQAPSVGDAGRPSTVDDIDLLWPPVRARPATLEFGEVLLNQPVTKTISLVNTGDADLTLVDSRTNCGCTTADVTGLVVPANGTLELPVHFDAEGRVGNRHATVTLFFVGWDRPITFNIRAVVINPMAG